MNILKSGTYSYEPEPPLTPPEDKYITASCGHEVFSGEETFTWENKTLCSDCFKDKIDEMSLGELAALLGCEHRAVSFGGQL